MTPSPGHVDEIPCQEFVELVTDYFEGALPDRAHSQVEEHLVMCQSCATYAEQMRSTIAGLRALRSDPTVGQPSDAVLAALRRRRGEAE
jgi:anti-sigma factor RsiW